MKIKIIKNDDRIYNIKQWYDKAHPQGGERQWKPGRSAFEMARFALSDNFPIFVSEIIREINCKSNGFECEPEALTAFENNMGKNGSRHHDLLMIGNDTVIGIEAKVSEPYDKKIKDKRIGATDNMNKRLDSCISYLLGQNKSEEVEQLYYQLFSATIGTILEAKRRTKKKAVVLFLTFTGNVSMESNYINNMKVNNEAFKKFCEALCLGDKGGVLTNIPGLDKEHIEVWIKSVEVNIGTYTY